MTDYKIYQVRKTAQAVLEEYRDAMEALEYEGLKYEDEKVAALELADNLEAAITALEDAT